MKLYQCIVMDPQEGYCYAWAATRIQADDRGNALAAKHDAPSFEVRRLKIGDTGRAVADFLQTNLTRDQRKVKK